MKRCNLFVYRTRVIEIGSTRLFEEGGYLPIVGIRARIRVSSRIEVLCGSIKIDQKVRAPTSQFLPIVAHVGRHYVCMLRTEHSLKSYALSVRKRRHLSCFTSLFV